MFAMQAIDDQPDPRRTVAHPHQAAPRGEGAGHRGERNEPRAGPDYAATLAPTYFNYRKTSIYAGSNEIQHNIMAKMVLGL